MENLPDIVALIVPIPSGGLREERGLLRQLFYDLSRERIRILPLPPPWARADSPWYWREWEYWYQGFRFEEWEYWLYRWWRHHPESWRHHSEWRNELRYILRRAADRGEIRAVVLLALVDKDRAFDYEEFYDFLRDLDPAVIIHLTIGEADQYIDERIPWAKTLNYPDDRLELLRFLTRSADKTQLAPYPALEVPSSEGHPAMPSEQVAPIDRPLAKPDEVHLGVSAPRVVSPEETFVARFAAYTDSNRNEIMRKLELEAPSSQQRLDLESCRWHRNTKVTVRLEVNAARVSNPVQTFRWNGAWKILRFDVEVLDDTVPKRLILRFDVAVEGLPIMAIRPEIEVLNDKGSRIGTVESSFVERAAPKSAFASYAKRDRREVLGRVRSLQIFTGIDVFLDCLSLRPGDEWKPKLLAEISAREIFWLFWSRRAIDSEWVKWEWKTALALKSLAGIQPHPLEPMELAPPPKELSDLQFGTMYEWYMSQLRESWPIHHIRMLSHCPPLLFGKPLLMMGRSRFYVRLTIFTALVISIIAICVTIITWMGH